jgi:hypothetical protein
MKKLILIGFLLCSIFNSASAELCDSEDSLVAGIEHVTKVYDLCISREKVIEKIKEGFHLDEVTITNYRRNLNLGYESNPIGLVDNMFTSYPKVYRVIFFNGTQSLENGSTLRADYKCDVKYGSTFVNFFTINNCETSNIRISNSSLEVKVKDVEDIKL